MRQFFDAMLGRSRPVKSKLEKLFAISTAYLTLTVDQRLQPGGRAGICFRAIESSRFTSLEDELRDLLKISGKESGTTVKAMTDSYNFQWIVMEAQDFDELVATIHMVSLTLQDWQFGEQLLAAVFRFERPAGAVYWIYNYKRGAFYPFVPAGPGGAAGQSQARDNAFELKLAAVMERELAVDKDPERWYALWGVPV